MMLLNLEVVPEWVDYNGHMNDAEYARVFSLAVEALMGRIGLDAIGRDRHAYTIYTLETHLCYRQEVHAGQPIRVTLKLLDHDRKRLQVYFEMLDDTDQVLATSEQMLMGMSTERGRPEAFPVPVATAVAALPQAEPGHWPAFAGRRIALRR